MAEFTLKHERHAHHMSAVATGVMITGPMGDGMTSLVFYRDSAKIIEETFESEERDIPGGKELKLTNSGSPPKMEHLREDVVTLLVPTEKFAGFVHAMQKVVDTLQERNSSNDGEA